MHVESRDLTPGPFPMYFVIVPGLESYLKMLRLDLKMKGLVISQVG
jgi:hypothetical protein